MLAEEQKTKRGLSSSSPLYPLLIEMHAIFNYAQKVLGWDDAEFAKRAGHFDFSILQRTRRETYDLLAGAPTPVPHWDTILAFAWALCDHRPTYDFTQWLVHLEHCYIQAIQARPREHGQTGQMRALTRQMRAQGLIPKMDSVEMSPTLKEIFEIHNG